VKNETFININEVRALAARYPAVTLNVIRRVMTDIVTRLESEVVRRTPAGVGGSAGLRGSIFGEVAATAGQPVTGLVGTAMPYGEVRELGRRPGKMPPVDPIAMWARSILGLGEKEAKRAAYAIAMKISRVGYKGAFMFRDGWAAMEGWAMDRLNSIPDMIVREIERG
jgi:hypothetical protein